MCVELLYSFFQHKNSVHYHKYNLVGLCVKCYFFHIVTKKEFVQQVLVKCPQYKISRKSLQ